MEGKNIYLCIYFVLWKAKQTPENYKEIAILPFPKQPAKNWSTEIINKQKIKDSEQIAGK